jgi:hypothetical protein
MYNELGKLYTMVARAGRITKRVTARHTERNPVKRTLYYAVHTSRTKRERKNCVTQQRQWISIRKLIRHLRPALRDRRRAAKKWDGRRKRSLGGYITTTDGGANQIKIIKKRSPVLLLLMVLLLLLSNGIPPSTHPDTFESPQTFQHGNVLNFIPD